MRLSNRRKETFEREIQIYALWDNYGSLPAYEEALCYSGNEDLVAGSSHYWENPRRMLLDLGDTYFDRNEQGGFAIGKLRGVLRKRGVNISTILGNHDAYMIAFILGIPMPQLWEGRIAHYGHMSEDASSWVWLQICTDFLRVLWGYDRGGNYRLKMPGFLELARFIKTPFVSSSEDSHDEELLGHIFSHREEILPNMRIHAPEVLEELKHFKLFDRVGKYIFWHTDPSKEVLSFLLENKWDIHKINAIFQDNIAWLIDHASFPAVDAQKQYECVMNVWNVWKDALHVDNRIPEFYYQPSGVAECEELLQAAREWMFDGVPISESCYSNWIQYYETQLQMRKMEEEEKSSVVGQMAQLRELMWCEAYVHAHSTTAGKPTIRKLWPMCVINVDTGYWRVWNKNPKVDPAVIHLKAKVPLRVEDLLSVAKRNHVHRTRDR